jgi:hypothetical protein
VVEAPAGRETMTAAPTLARVNVSWMRLFRDQPIPTLAEMQLMRVLRKTLEAMATSFAAVRARSADPGSRSAKQADRQLHHQTDLYREVFDQTQKVNPMAVRKAVTA